MSICSICLILLDTELNDLTIYQADVINAYLEAYTREKINFTVRKEFTTFRIEGHVLIISKAPHMGYGQVENNFIKFLQIYFTSKDLHPVKQILMYG